MLYRIGNTILITLLLSVEIYAEALFAGGISSVNSDSRFNALRNPALMSLQSDDNISFMYLYSYLINSLVDTDVKVGAFDGITDTSQDEDYNGALLLSGVVKSGKNSFGFGVSKNGEDQVVFSSSDTDTQISGYMSESSEEKSYYGSNILMSYSYRINNNDSMGIQLETSASRESIEKDEKNNSPSVKNLKIEKTRITAGCIIGYNYREEFFEFGAVFKAGSYGYENQKYELNLNSVYSEKKISNYYMHDDGFGVLLGVVLKPSSDLRLSFEGGYVVPYTFKEKSCNEDTLAESISEVNIIYVFLARGGINYKYSRFLDIGFGMSYTTYKAESAGENAIQTGSNTIYLYQLISGIDIKPSNDYTLLFALNYKRTVFDSQFKESGIGLSMDIGLEKNSLEAICGASCNF